MGGIGCDSSSRLDNDGGEGHGIDAFVVSVVVAVNHAVVLLKGVTGNVGEFPGAVPHAMDGLVVVQEGHEVVLKGFTGHNEFVHVEDNEPFRVGHANHHVFQQTLSTDRVLSSGATVVIVLMVGRPNVRHIGAVDHEVGQMLVVLVVDNVKMLHTQRSIMTDPPIEPFLGVLGTPGLRIFLLIDGIASLVETILFANRDGGRQLVLVPTLCQGGIHHGCQLLGCLVGPVVYLQGKGALSQFVPKLDRDVEMSHYEGARVATKLVETCNGKGLIAKR